MEKERWEKEKKGDRGKEKGKGGKLREERDITGKEEGRKKNRKKVDR